MGECGSSVRVTALGSFKKSFKRCSTSDRFLHFSGYFASSGDITRPSWKTSSSGKLFCSKLRTRNVEETAPNCRVMAAITCPRKPSSSGTEASPSNILGELGSLSPVHVGEPNRRAAADRDMEKFESYFCIAKRRLKCTR